MCLSEHNPFGFFFLELCSQKRKTDNLEYKTGCDVCDKTVILLYLEPKSQKLFGRILTKFYQLYIEKYYNAVAFGWVLCRFYFCIND